MSHVVYSLVRLVIFVLDVSPSMQMSSDPMATSPIRDLNVVLRKLYEALSRKVGAQILGMHIRFAEDAHIERPFEDVRGALPPEYKTEGVATDYSAAASLALLEADEQRAALRADGREVDQPMIVFISDGKPNRCTNPGYDVELKSRIERGKLTLLPVAVGGGESYDALSAISPKQTPVIVGSDDADSLSFDELLVWLEGSIDMGKADDLPNTGDDDLD